MESFQQYAQREYSIGPVEFAELQTLHASHTATLIVAKILREQSEGERVAAIGAGADRDSYVHLGAWKALQRAADFLTNRISDFDHMIQEFQTLPQQEA